MKNSAIEIFCDWGIVFGLCASIFVLPASVAFLDSFAALAVFFYLIKKISRIVIDWPLRSAPLNVLGKCRSVWNGFSPPENILDRPLQLLSLAIFISVVFSAYPGLSFLAFFGKFVKSIFVYFSFLEAMRDEKRIRLFITFLLASAFLTAICGVVQQFNGHDFLKGHRMAGGRVSSFFKEANGLAAYLVPVIGLAVSLLFTAFTRKRSWILTVALTALLIVLLSCLCWTYSRSSWIGCMVIFFVMTLLDRRKVFLAGALLLLIILVFLPSLKHVRHLHLITDDNVTSVQKGSLMISALKQGGSGRISFWKNAVSIIRTSPICGTGFNTYTRVIKRNPDKNTWWYAHNCYLQLTAETGLLGLGCFLWMLFVLLRHGLSYCRQISDPWPLTYLQGTVAGLIGYLVQSFFDNTFYTSQLGLLMWILMGLLVAVTRINIHPREKV